MNVYKTKIKKLGATRYSEVAKQARNLFKSIRGNTKRQPHIKSAFFHGEKIFLNFFWSHLSQKPPAERFKRLQYLSCGIDLITNSRLSPIVTQSPDKPEMLYRFEGQTADGEIFFVQVKENVKTKRKYLMSVFPKKQKSPAK